MLLWTNDPLIKRAMLLWVRASRRPAETPNHPGAVTLKQDVEAASSVVWPIDMGEADGEATDDRVDSELSMTPGDTDSLHRGPKPVTNLTRTADLPVAGAKPDVSTTAGAT
jgi:hypothetical protein